MQTAINGKKAMSLANEARQSALKRVIAAYGPDKYEGILREERTKRGLAPEARSKADEQTARALRAQLIEAGITPVV